MNRSSPKYPQNNTDSWDMQYIYILIYYVLKLTLVHVGSLGKPGAETDHYVEWLKEYCQAFFSGPFVKLLPAVTVAETRCSFRVNDNSQNLQIHIGKILIAFL